MALINRITKLFQADMHAVLDHIEEPELLLKQAIREMREDLLKDEQQISNIEAEQVKIIATEAKLKKFMAGVKQELDLCFESKKHELARSLIKRRLETERFCEQLADKRKGMQQRLVELKVRYEENFMQLESMQQKADLLIAEVAPGSEGIYRSWEMPQTTVSADDIEIAFLNEQQRRA